VIATRRSIDFSGGMSFVRIRGFGGGGFGDKEHVFTEQVAL
jgi:hypothetical protein